MTKQELSTLTADIEKAEALFMVSSQSRSGRTAKITIFGNNHIIISDYKIGNMGSGWGFAFYYNIATAAEMKDPGNWANEQERKTWRYYM